LGGRQNGEKEADIGRLPKNRQNRKIGLRRERRWDASTRRRVGVGSKLPLQKPNEDTGAIMAPWTKAEGHLGKQKTSHLKKCLPGGRKKRDNKRRNDNMERGSGPASSSEKGRPQPPKTNFTRRTKKKREKYNGSDYEGTL